MKIYNYSRETGEFLSESVARESPKEPGVFLLPACATKIAPPFPGNGKVAVFTGDGWEAKDDQRGAVYWTTNGDKVTIDAIGVVKPADALDEAPARVPTADELRAEKMAQGKVLVLQLPVSVRAAIAPHWITIATLVDFGDIEGTKAYFAAAKAQVLAQQPNLQDVADALSVVIDSL